MSAVPRLHRFIQEGKDIRCGTFPRQRFRIGKGALGEQCSQLFIEKDFAQAISEGIARAHQQPRIIGLATKASRACIAGTSQRERRRARSRGGAPSA